MIMMPSYLLYSVLQLFIATLAFAAPVAKTTTDNPLTYGTGGGILGIIVLILDIIVFSTSKLASPVNIPQEKPSCGTIG